MKNRTLLIVIGVILLCCCVVVIAGAIAYPRISKYLNSASSGLQKSESFNDFHSGNRLDQPASTNRAAFKRTRGWRLGRPNTQRRCVEFDPHC